MKERNLRKSSPLPLWKINKIYCWVYDSHIRSDEETIRQTTLHGGWQRMSKFLGSCRGRNLPDFVEPRSHTFMHVQRRESLWRPVHRCACPEFTPMKCFLLSSGYQGLFPWGLKRPGREADHSPPSRAEVKEWVELYLHSPICLHGVVLSYSTGATLTLYLLKSLRFIEC
jgi:hypothetical protein